MSNLSGTAKMAFFGTATISATNVATGRETTCDRPHQLVERWTRALENLESHDGWSLIRSALCTIPCVTLPEIECFRGIFERRLGGPSPMSNQMGPPQASYTNGDRYNRKEEPVLYLSQTVDGVLREMSRDGEEDSIWIQRYWIPTRKLRVADLRADSAASSTIANQVLWFTERATPDGDPNFRFSQFFAQLVSEFFDGMLVPGVRGVGANYNNIVVFRPEGIWQAWLDKNRPFLAKDTADDHSGANGE